MPDGFCNICSVWGPLSFEHTPPESAFNNCKVLYMAADKYWNRGPGRDKSPKGKSFQRGYGRNSICEGCNHKTARWYVYYFAAWCKQGMEFYDCTKRFTSYLHIATLSPLPVIKQIATIFLARYGDSFTLDKKASLVRFVLNKEQRYLDPRYRFWVYQIAPGPLRDVPPCGIIDVKSSTTTFGAEFAFPPFGYMMTLDSSPNDNRLCEITHFARYSHLDITQIALQMAVLPNHGPTLGDFRTFRDMPTKNGTPNVVLEHISSSI